MFFVFLFKCRCTVVQPTPTVLAHFQGWANSLTTAHPVNTHGYHNHVCSGLRVIMSDLRKHATVAYFRIFGVYRVHIFCFNNAT